MKSVGWRACVRCISIVADCLSSHESPPGPSDGEPGRVRLGASGRARALWLRCHYRDRTEDRQLVIAERDAELDMGSGTEPSKAFAVYEAGVLLGVEVSPVSHGLTLEGMAVRLADILDCDAVEEVLALETDPPESEPL